MIRKKQLFLQIIPLLLFPFFGFTQNFSGFNYGNYSGIHGVTTNPANVVGSPYFADINIISGSLFVDNDYATINLNEAIKGEYSDIGDILIIAADNSFTSASNNLNLNTEILGPSFMINLNPLNSIGFFSKIRYTTGVSDINVEAFDRLTNGEVSDDEDYNLVISESAISAHAWSEIGVSYGRMINKTTYSSLRIGINAKYLKGIGNVFMSFKNAVIDYHSDTFTVDTSGELSYGISSIDAENIVDIDLNNIGDLFDKNATGFGFDMGVIYEWSPFISEEKLENIKPKFYKYRLGISITDIGKIAYTNGTQTTYNLQKTGISQDDFNDDDEFITIVETLYAGQITENKLVVSLPTAARINFDWSITDNFYLNLNGDFAISNITKNASTIITNYSLTPRFETKWLSAYTPINYDAYNNLGMGIGVRFGPVFIGSNTALSAIFTPIKKVDLHFGVKVPLYKKSIKKVIIE